jgi:hypothetical protein
MLNRDLRLALSYPHQYIQVWAVIPGFEDNRSYGIDTAVDDGSFMVNEARETFTIIEVNDSKTKTATVSQVRTALANFNPEDEVLIFVPGWKEQQYAYFEVDSVRFDVPHSKATIILGDWRYGA